MKNLTTSENMPEPALLTGAIDYPLMNDYMFRSVMQSSEEVLKGLLCALLRLNPEDVRTVQILNPIELGKNISDIKNYQKYSDKFTIHVLDLTQVHLAEREDKEQELDRWAKLFYASTWEEFKMISAENKCMEEAGKTLFTLNGNDQIREQCEAREDYRRTWEGVKQEMEEKNTAIEELKSSNKELRSLNENKNTVIEELKSLNEKNNTIIEELKSSNEEKDALIASLQAQIAGSQKL